MDLTGLTRMRWRTRTENLHVLHPVVKLADGTLLVGSHTAQALIVCGYRRKRRRRVATVEPTSPSPSRESVAGSGTA